MYGYVNIVLGIMNVDNMLTVAKKRRKMNPLQRMSNIIWHFRCFWDPRNVPHPKIFVKNCNIFWTRCAM